MGKGRIRAYVVDTDAKSVMRIIEDDRSAMLRQLEVHRLTQPNAKPILLVWVTWHLGPQVAGGKGGPTPQPGGDPSPAELVAAATALEQVAIDAKL
jgi:hypothetical protein